MQQEQLAIQGKGLTGAATTATGLSVSTLEQVDLIVSIAAGSIGALAGLFTIGWYLVRFYKLYRGDTNDQTNSSE